MRPLEKSLVQYFFWSSVIETIITTPYTPLSTAHETANFPSTQGFVLGSKVRSLNDLCFQHTCVQTVHPASHVTIECQGVTIITWNWEKYERNSEKVNKSQAPNFPSHSANVLMGMMYKVLRCP